MIILGAVAVVITITILGLCKASKKGNEILEHPERIKIRE